MCILKYIPLTGIPPAENFASTERGQQGYKEKREICFYSFFFYNVNIRSVCKNLISILF